MLVMMRHVEVYRFINITCTIIPRLSMISRSGSMKHEHVKHLINGELPPGIFCCKPSRYILKRRVQCGPDGMEPPSIMWMRRINRWLWQIHPHRYHLIMRMNKMQKSPNWRHRSRWKTYMLWRRWIKMLYPGLSQRMGWSDVLIVAAIHDGTSTESVQYIKRRLSIVDDWVTMQLAQDHNCNTISNASYFDDELGFAPSDRGSEAPSVPSTFNKPLCDAYPVNWFGWICRNIK